MSRIQNVNPINMRFPLSDEEVADMITPIAYFTALIRGLIVAGWNGSSAEEMGRAIDDLVGRYDPNNNSIQIRIHFILKNDVRMRVVLYGGHIHANADRLCRWDIIQWHDGKEYNVPENQPYKETQYLKSFELIRLLRSL